MQNEKYHMKSAKLRRDRNDHDGLADPLLEFAALFQTSVHSVLFTLHFAFFTMHFCTFLTEFQIRARPLFGSGTAASVLRISLAVGHGFLYCDRAIIGTLPRPCCNIAKCTLNHCFKKSDARDFFNSLG